MITVFSLILRERTRLDFESSNMQASASYHDHDQVITNVVRYFPEKRFITPLAVQ